MAGSDPARERAAARLRQRLWGAAVLIALAVIVLPLLLDGSGSESQFRRVENLREEPPRIVAPDARIVVDGVVPRDAQAQAEADDSDGGVATIGRRVLDLLDPSGEGEGEDAGDDASSEQAVAVVVTPTVAVPVTPVTVVRDAPIVPAPASPPGGVGQDGSATSGAGEPSLGEAGPRAWAVQAGSFRERENALAVRDGLRRAGHPSFVSEADLAGAPMHRVQVGPMADRASAEALREKVISLLGREAIVVAYP